LSQSGSRRKEELLQKLGIKDFPGHVWKCDESGMADHFQWQKAIGAAGASCYQLTTNEIISDIAIFVLKRDVKLQLTN